MIKELYERYKRDVFTYLVSITRDADLSEDLTSETFLAAMEGLASFKGKSDVKTWLFSIARFRWYRHLRKKHESVEFDALAERYMGQCEGVESRVLGQEMSRRFSELLEDEPERTRDIVRMRTEGYSFHEIALKHGISEGSARVIDFRARRRIREILEKEELL